MTNTKEHSQEKFEVFSNHPLLTDFSKSQGETRKCQHVYDRKCGSIGHSGEADYGGYSAQNKFAFITFDSIFNE